MKVFKPGFICKVEDTKKTVHWATEELELPGKIIKSPKPSPEKLPLFELIDKLSDLQNVFSQFRYDESISIFEQFYSFESLNPSNFSQTVIFTPNNYALFISTHTYKSRTPLLSSIAFIVKRSVFPQLSDLSQQKNHSQFTCSKFKNTQKNYLKQKAKLELNLKAEYDLFKEREKLQELIKANRPFLNVGFTGVKTSKHAVCVEKQRKRDVKAKIEEKTHTLEIQLNMAQSIMEKNLKLHIFKVFQLTTTFSKNLSSLIAKSNERSLYPVVFYTFAAWISYTKLKKEKQTCIVLAKSAISLYKTLKIFQNWRTLSEKPKKLQRFYEDVGIYMRKRKLARLFVSWEWFKSYKKLKDFMNILSRKLYRERLKLKKFFEFKTEVLSLKGARIRYQFLAEGEESSFNKNDLIGKSKFSYTVQTRRLLSSLSKYKEEIFLQAQSSLAVQQRIAKGCYYPKDCATWASYLFRKYKNN